MTRHATRRLLFPILTLLLVAGFLVLPRPEASATPEGGVPNIDRKCPSGWTEWEQTRSTRLRHCFNGDIGNDRTPHFLMVRNANVDQYATALTAPACQTEWGTPTYGDPIMTKKTPAAWLEHLSVTCASGPHQPINDAAVVINGMMFHADDRLSYPFQTGTLPGGYMYVGDETIPADDRVCISFGGFNSHPSVMGWDPGPISWNLASSTFDTCRTLGANNSKHRLVSPNLDYTPNCSGFWPARYCQRTIMGTGEDKLGEMVCILTLGWFPGTNWSSEVRRIFKDFGCTAEVQLDGGASSGIALNYDGTIWTKAATPRSIPHVIVIGDDSRHN